MFRKFKFKGTTNWEETRRRSTSFKNVPIDQTVSPNPSVHGAQDPPPQIRALLRRHRANPLWQAPSSRLLPRHNPSASLTTSSPPLPLTSSPKSSNKRREEKGDYCLLQRSSHNNTERSRLYTFIYCFQMTASMGNINGVNKWKILRVDD